MKSNSCPTWISDILLQRLSTQCAHSRALNLGINPFTCRSEKSLADVLPQTGYFYTISSAYEDRRTPAPLSSVPSVSLSLVDQEARASRSDGLSSHSTSRQSILETAGVEDDMKKKNLNIASQFFCQIKKPIKKLGRVEGIITPWEMSYNWSGTVCSWRWFSFLQNTQVSEGRACGRISNLSLNLQRTLKTKGHSTSL